MLIKYTGKYVNIYFIMKIIFFFFFFFHIKVFWCELKDLMAVSM